MDRTTFDTILTAILNHRPLSWAITDAGVPVPEFYAWVAMQPKANAYTAALYRASADSRRALAQGVASDLGRRIDAGLITTAALASIEGDQIKRLNKEADALEVKADKALAALTPPPQRPTIMDKVEAQLRLRG